MAIKDSGERTQFESGAVRDMHQGKGRMDLLPWEALIEVAKHCEEGAAKYGERNCEKGIPIHSLIDSGFRHLAKYMMGMDDEPPFEGGSMEYPLCPLHGNQTPGNAGHSHQGRGLARRGHGEKSVLMATLHMELTEEEMLCIRWHMGAFDDKANWNGYTEAVEKCPNVLYTHTADMIASQVMGV